MQARDWVAKASFSSKAPTSASFTPLRARTFCVAGTGPMPMISGGTPAEAPSTIRARAVRPYSRMARSDATMMAEAPSFSVLELPAVTMPPDRTTGRSLASTSAVVPSRGPSSVSTTVSPLRPRTVTGTISSLKCPAAMAASAFSWDRTANASASSREMPSTAASSSAVSGMEYVILPSRESSPEAKRSFTKRQPMEVSKVSPGLAKALVGFSVTQGARLMDSVPPAMTMSAAPALIMCEAMMMADSPEAQSRFTVMPGTSLGKPASSAARRATLRFSSPAPLALPRMTSSTTAGSSPSRATSSCSVSAARSSGRTLDSAPPYLPTGVRTPPTRNASVIVAPTVCVPPADAGRAAFTDHSFCKELHGGVPRSM